MEDLKKFRKAFMRVANFAMRNLLFEFSLAYHRERDPDAKKERKKVFEQAKSDLFKVISVLTVMERIPVEKIYLTDQDGRMYDCSNPEPKDVEGNELADLLIEFSGKLK